MALTFAGLLLGIVGGLAVTRVMGDLLFGVTTTDAVTFMSVAGLLVVVAFLACYVPARRATKVDPLIALRYE
jgi:putative ABC transport system permease protein